MLDRKDIDAVFRNGLANHEEIPGEYVWESIEKSMVKQSRQIRLIVMWRSVAAACIIILLSISFGLLHQFSNSHQAEGLEVSSENRTEKEASAITKHNGISDNNKQQESQNIKTPTISEVKRNKPNTTKQHSYESYESYKADNYSELNYLASNSDIHLNTNFELKQKLHNKQKKTYYSLYTPTIRSEAKKKKTSISIGGMISPSYNSKINSGGNNQVMAASNTTVNENGINSLGGGLQVRVNTGSRWSFETGVLYSQVGQEVSSTQNFLSFNPAFSRAQKANEIGITNSLGPIKTKKQPLNEPLHDNTNALETTYSPAAPINELRQTLDYIEIPMMARYSLIESFPYISVAGGLSSNFLVNNSAYAIDNGSSSKIGETDHIKSFVLSSSVGLGVDVPILKYLHLNIEPRFKYFLNSVSSSDNYNFQPYSFGVYGGLTFIIN